MPLPERKDLDTESVENAIIAYLKQANGEVDDIDLSSVDMAAASNRDALVEPVHVFVLCRNLEHRGDGLYVADVAVTVVTPIEENSNLERRFLREMVAKRLHAESEYRRFFHEETIVRSYGWEVVGPAEISEVDGHQTGDVFTLTMGVAREG
jgi:hypothetical protein